MALVHAVIGLGEALITGAVVRFLLLRRPDLFDEPAEATSSTFAGGANWGQAMVGGLAVALAIAVFLAPFASDQPDGLEYVGQKLGFLRRKTPAPMLPAPMPDYQLPIAGAEHVKLATAAAGVVGTLAGLRRRWGMARILPRPKPTRHTPMRPDALERHRERTGPLHRLDARLKLIAALAFVVVVVATPIGSWTAFGVEGFILAFLIGLSGIPPRELARRWLAFLVLVGFLALLIAPAHPARARYGLGVVAASILIKNSLALLTMLVLAG